jgi:hypothetical protein
MCQSWEAKARQTSNKNAGHVVRARKSHQKQAQSPVADWYVCAKIQDYAKAHHTMQEIKFHGL